MSFFTTVVNIVSGWAASHLGGLTCSISYDIIKPVLDYVWFKADEGYFLDFPEDTEKENSVKNIVKRLRAMTASGKDRVAYAKAS